MPDQRFVSSIENANVTLIKIHANDLLTIDLMTNDY